jgi:hypothetical protein
MQEKQRRLVKGTIVIAMAIVALLAFWVPQPGAATKASKTMPTLVVMDDPDKKNTEFAGDYGKAPFDHDQHIAYSSYTPQDSCVVCHHTNAKTLTKAVEEEVLKCGACHKAEETTNELEGTNEDKKFKGLKAISSEEAFHGKESLIGCIGCHKERDKKPTSCKECHTGEDTITYQYKK